MGNLLQPGPSNSLLLPPSNFFSTLTNCIHHSGSYNELSLITKKLTSSIYIHPASLKFYFTNTPLSGREVLIHSKFSHPRDGKVNIMEVAASLITYSACSLSEKVKLAFMIFDFDKNQAITKEEMVILCISFLNGISIVNQSSFSAKQHLKQLGEEAFSLANSSSREMITQEELENWILSSEVLKKLFDRQKFPAIKRRVSLLESQGFELTEKSRLFMKNLRVKVKSKTRKVSQHDRLKIELDKFYEKKKIPNGGVKTIDFLDFANGSLLSHGSDILFNILKKKYFSTISKQEMTSSLRKTLSKSMDSSPRDYGNLVLSEKVYFTLKRLFKKYDLNQDGVVSLKELKIALNSKISNEAIEDIFQEYDEDKDGLLTLQEFIRMFTPKNVLIPFSKYDEDFR